MTNDELDQQLRRIPVPPRDPEYWQTFPETVTRRIAAEAKAWHRPPAQSVSERARQRRAGGSWRVLVPATAAALVILAVVWFSRPGPRPTDSTAAGSSAGRSPSRAGSPDPWSAVDADPRATLLKVYEEVAELFPGRLQAIVLGQDGAQLQLSEKADVPTSPPVFIRLCSPAARCTTAVSFSGQTVRLDGSDFEVLTSGADEVFLLARDRLLTPGPTVTEANQNEGPGPWRLDAGWLSSARAVRSL